MTPRIHVATVDYDATYDEVVAVLQESQYSRLPVLSEEGDEIVGVLHIKDILMKPVVLALSLFLVFFFVVKCEMLISFMNLIIFQMFLLLCVRNMFLYQLY